MIPPQTWISKNVKKMTVDAIVILAIHRNAKIANLTYNDAVRLWRLTPRSAWNEKNTKLLFCSPTMKQQLTIN
ncbi:MAG: hypothetical protein VSS52_005805 [Thiotrichaceae bacterium]|nr:hypothetical protein [Thiotrichaceae bacterium]